MLARATAWAATVDISRALAFACRNTNIANNGTSRTRITIGGRISQGHSIDGGGRVAFCSVVTHTSKVLGPSNMEAVVMCDGEADMPDCVCAILVAWWPHGRSQVISLYMTSILTFFGDQAGPIVLTHHLHLL